MAIARSLLFPGLGFLLACVAEPRGNGQDFDGREIDMVRADAGDPYDQGPRTGTSRGSTSDATSSSAPSPDADSHQDGGSARAREPDAASDAEVTQDSGPSDAGPTQDAGLDAAMMSPSSPVDASWITDAARTAASDAGGKVTVYDAALPKDSGPTDPPAIIDAAPPSDPNALCTSCGACEEILAVTRAEHITGDLVYPDPPPVGGDHNPCWTRFGVHDEPVPDERWVHNLEHGAVVFLYNCPRGCPEQVAALRTLVSRCGSWAVLTPYDLMPEGFAAISWGHRIVSKCLDLQAFATFYANNKDHGSESENANPPGDCPP